jgi:hypothetical protein
MHTLSTTCMFALLSNKAAITLSLSFVAHASNKGVFSSYVFDNES